MEKLASVLIKDALDEDLEMSDLADAIDAGKVELHSSEDEWQWIFKLFTLKGV